MAVILLALTIACTLREGLGVVLSVQPPSGTLIANFEGTENATTLNCNVSIDANQISTTWSIQNYRGSTGLVDITGGPAPFVVSGDPHPSAPGFTLLNVLTISNWTADLDGVTIFCGTGQDQREASFFFRVYRPPKLQDKFAVKVLENSQNVTIDLHQEPAAFPEPTLFNWKKDRQPLADQAVLTYSNVTFGTVRRADTGNYTVAATNFVLPGSPENNQVGNDTGSFYLDVIYGPSLAAIGPSQYFVLLGNPLSLVCGTGLDSNPQATITWISPDVSVITDSSRYRLENGPEIVQLSFTHTILSDAGMWRCNIRTESDQNVVKNENLVPLNSTVIGVVIQCDIELVIIAPPGQPHMISVKDREATLFQVCWEAPVQSDSHISYYMIRACNLNSSAESNKVTTNTITNETFYNVTGLLPGTTYELTVVAVSQGGNVIAESQPSGPIVNTTGVTVPAVTCNASVSGSGVVMVIWSYIHTGGLPLTNVSVSYTFENEFIISRPIAVSITSVDSTMITVPDLEPGFRYTLNITVQNGIGFTSTLCGLMIPVPDLSPSATVSTAAIAGGVIGGLVALGFIVVGFVITLLILSLRRKGKGAISSKAVVVYEDPDDLQLQEYRPKNDKNIELKECPAYEKPVSSEQPGTIELVDCPAYVEKKKDQDIRLEDCPTYGHLAS